MTRHTAYILCGTPRTGSTLLCELLTSSGVAGCPDSFFWRETLEWWAQHWQMPERTPLPKADHDRAFLAAALQQGRGGTGIFGLRLMQESLHDLAGFLGGIYPDCSGDGALFARAFGLPLYIHLSRADKVAQAISFAKAQQTGLWHRAPDGTEIERLAPHKPPRYDGAALHRQVLAFEREDAAWRTWFERQSITPLMIRYEDLACDPQGTLGVVLAALGQDSTLAARVEVGLAKLADEVSRDWHARYLAEFG